MRLTNLEQEKKRRLEIKCTRSNDSPLLVVIKSKCSPYDHSVAKMSANGWNKLSVSTRNTENIAVFKKLLKITATSHKQKAIKPKLLLKQSSLCHNI